MGFFSVIAMGTFARRKTLITMNGIISHIFQYFFVEFSSFITIPNLSSWKFNHQYFCYCYHGVVSLNAFLQGEAIIQLFVAMQIGTLVIGLQAHYSKIIQVPIVCYFKVAYLHVQHSSPYVKL